MRLRWIAIVLCACGDSGKAPVAPIIVADQAASAAAPPASAGPAPAPAPAPEPAPQPAPQTAENDPQDPRKDPNMWAPIDDGGVGLGRIGATSSGSGSGGPVIGGMGKTSAPSLRQGAVTVNGRLPPEVIQRIVRQNFGRYRLCYENGLRANPKLGGRVTVKFTIDRAGAVSKTGDGGSDLPDKSVVACVVKGFANLSFPQPESGEVNVVYPIVFAPGA